MEMEVTMGHWAAPGLSAFPTVLTQAGAILSLWTDDETVAWRVEVS